MDWFIQFEEVFNAGWKDLLDEGLLQARNFTHHHNPNPVNPPSPHAMYGMPCIG